MAFLGRVVIFSITGCPFCKRAKSLLASLSVPFYDINLEKYPERRYEMQEKTGRRTVPQIFFNARHIGGWDDLKTLYDNNQLEDLIKETADNEAPFDAPEPPNVEDLDSADETEIILLPSQRGSTGRTECTPDELASLVQEIQESSRLVKTHTYHLIAYKNSVVGRELVEWFMTRKGMSREEAVSMGKELIDRHFIHHVTFEHDFEDEYLFYRFLGDLKTRSLNARLSHHCLPRKAPEVADDLRKLILEVYAEHLSPDGYAVDYKGISTSPKFEEYVRATAELKRVDLFSLTRNEKIAFFINIYNALVIHGFVVQGPPTNTIRRLIFFNQTSYIIGGQEFSLNEMENGILRSNRKAIAAFRKPFSRNDPRLPIALQTQDPRVHFALVCGAKSCPPIKTYTPEKLDEELTLATEAYFEGDKCIVDLKKREVSLSMVMKWYKIDFGNDNHEVLLWIYDHLPECAKKRDLQQLISANNYRVKYQTYNWDVNSA